MVPVWKRSLAASLWPCTWWPHVFCDNTASPQIRWRFRAWRCTNTPQMKWVSVMAVSRMMLWSDMVLLLLRPSWQVINTSPLTTPRVTYLWVDFDTQREWHWADTKLSKNITNIDELNYVYNISIQYDIVNIGNLFPSNSVFLRLICCFNVSVA